MRIGIVALVIAIVMLVTIQNAAAGVGMSTLGTIKYENGTTCPYGWTVWMENMNASYGSEPWSYVSEFLPPVWDYKVTGEKETDSNYFHVWVESPDGKWFGESTAMYSAVEDTDWNAAVIHITVYEVPAETETFTKSLPLGWNLISLPLTPTDNSVSAVLTGVSQDAVKSYNAATHQFEDATTMDPGTGYFVHMTFADTWSYDGTACETMTASLSQGLNMVGWTNTNANLPDALSSITDSYRYVAHWNATSQSYEVYEPNAPAVFNDFTTMERGEGYFIAATSSCTLAYP